MKTGSVVADASVVISLSASLGFGRVLRELPYRFLVTAGVQGELEAGKVGGHTAATDLEVQVTTKRVVIIEPGESASDTSGHLKSQRSGRQLDAGEADTIACALDLDAIALIDEKRARGVCESGFTLLPVACTVYVFAHPNVAGLGLQELASLVRNAVERGRMHVVRCRDWVDELVGMDIRAKGGAAE